MVKFLSVTFVLVESDPDAHSDRSSGHESGASDGK